MKPLINQLAGVNSKTTLAFVHDFVDGESRQCPARSSFETDVR